jgi:anti-sigma28 factor (negative regulator of flagellin synthesis)
VLSRSSEELFNVYKTEATKLAISSGQYRLSQDTLSSAVCCIRKRKPTVVTEL